MLTFALGARSSLMCANESRSRESAMIKSFRNAYGERHLAPACSGGAPQLPSSCRLHSLHVAFSTAIPLLGNKGLEQMAVTFFTMYCSNTLQALYAAQRSQAADKVCCETKDIQARRLTTLAVRGLHALQQSVHAPPTAYLAETVALSPTAYGHWPPQGCHKGRHTMGAG